MAISLAAIHEAYEAANFGEPGMATGYVSKETGETYLYFEDGDNFDLPEDLDESPEYLVLPDKRDLDLGQRLVWDFVSDRLPEDADAVRTIFSSRGAYGRFKALLEDRGLLQEWYDFELDRTKQALLDWCGREGLDVTREG